MDKQQLLSGRVSDLSRQCWNGDYLTHTNFLSASELAVFFRWQGISILLVFPHLTALPTLSTEAAATLTGELFFSFPHI